MFRQTKTLFLVLSLVGFSRADECQCCGITGDVIGAITNAALANCSSNCVRLTPETCVQVKAGITNVLDTIQSSTDSSQFYISQLDTSLRYFQTSLQGLETSISDAIDLLQNSNSDMPTAFANIQRQVDSLSNSFVRAEIPSGKGRYMVLSNIFTGATITYTPSQSVVNRCSIMTRRINEAITTWESTTNQTQVVIPLQESLTELRQQQQEVDYMLTLLGGINNNMNDISNSATELRTTMESFDCDPCGKGGGSGSSGGGTSVDLTPVISAVQQLNDDLQYWMQRLYSLFQKYYQDYDTAASQGITGKATLQGYQALPNNWFKRIEYLLYSMADLQDVDTSNVPTKPDGDDDLSDFESSSSSSAESQDSTLRNKAESSLNKLRASVDNFLSAFQRLGFVNQNIDGSIVMEFPSTVDDSGTHYQLTIPQGFTSTFNFLRVAFKFVWHAGLVFLYWYFVKFAIFCIVSYVRWFLTLCSAVFGG